MKRRQALQHLAALTGGILAQPAWAKSWTPASLSTVSAGFMPPAARDLLTQIVGAILPESAIPGAVSLGVPAFIETMLADCYEKTVQDNVENGLQTVASIARKTYGKAFSALPAPEQQAILTGLEKGEDASLGDFYQLIKNLTILGYTSSEYVQTNYLEYEMAPNHYHGCIPVKS